MAIIRILYQQSKLSLVFAMVVGFFSGITSTMLIAMIGSALADPSQISRAFFERFLVALILVLTTYLASRLSLIRLTEQSQFHIQMHLARQILSTPFRRLEEVGAARLLATLSEDISSIASFMMVLPNVILHSSIIITCVLYLLWLSPPTALLLLAFMVPAVVGYAVITRRSRRHLITARRTRNESYKHYEALTIGKSELSLNRFRRSSFFHKLLYPTAKEYLDLRISGRTLLEAANTWSHVLYFVFVFFLLLLVVRGQDVSTAVLASYALVALYMRSSVATVLLAIPTVQHATVSMEAIQELVLAEPRPDIVDAPEQEVAIPRIHSLALNHASYSYSSANENHRFKLGPIDLRFGDSELVFIAGGNGSGKTTLLKLITGLYYPDEGQVLLDAIELNDENGESYRNHFSAIFADFYLFSQLLGVDSAEQLALAQRYLKEFELDNKVAIENDSFSTADLSFGQRKRLALITAYLEDRPIYIFDEWAAGQDPYFSELFYLELLPKLREQGKLVLVATHDDRYYHHADRLIKMEYGKIIFDGPPPRVTMRVPSVAGYSN
ncbi:MAG: cyclic peptide export ABC transporter [Caldilineales bacterium]|nr:cyclic peptide export ABC transporter [Caldilineales bacterium]